MKLKYNINNLFCDVKNMAWNDTASKIWMDGEMVDWKDAMIHGLSHVVHYGTSVFEGIRAYSNDKGTAIFRLEEHVKRLQNSAKIYKMDIPYSLSEISDAIIDVIKVNDLKSCYVRPIVYRGYGELGVNPLNCPVDLLIAAWEWGSYLGEEGMNNGINVGVSSWRKLAPDTLPVLSKTGANYMNSQLAKLEALEHGYDEAIMLDYAGFVAEGSGENIFLIEDGSIVTLSLDSSILKGITRESVIQLAESLGYEVTEERINRERLYIADEIFFTGTAAEVTPIRSVDERIIGNGKKGPVTDKIQKSFFEIVDNDKDDEFGWLTYI